jgi:ankyrin repeat protein
MSDFRSDLAEAAQNGNVAALHRLLDEQREAVSLPDAQGSTPLHYAAYFGHLEAARYLLDVGADAGAVSTDLLHHTPLHAAAAGGHAEIVRLLLAAGADLEAVQTGEWTALHAAAERGRASVVAVLLEAGARPAPLSQSGVTPVALARAGGHDATITLLEPLIPDL